MGGIGKTMLAARLAQDVAPSFERVYWRSVRNAPPLSEGLQGLVGILSDQRVSAPDDEAARLGLVVKLLNERPTLLVLDNLETLLEPGVRQARYRAGYEGFGALLQAFGEGRHHSCVVVTSREAPPRLGAIGDGHAVRVLELGGLGVAEGRALLADKQLTGAEHDWANLVAQFGGNGLALKVVGESCSRASWADSSNRPAPARCSGTFVNCSTNRSSAARRLNSTCFGAWPSNARR
jgi:hypothetical protein